MQNFQITTVKLVLRNLKSVKTIQHISDSISVNLDAYFIWWGKKYTFMLHKTVLELTFTLSQDAEWEKSYFSNPVPRQKWTFGLLFLLHYLQSVPNYFSNCSIWTSKIQTRECCYLKRYILPIRCTTTIYLTPFRTCLLSPLTVSININYLCMVQIKCISDTGLSISSLANR